MKGVVYTEDRGTVVTDGIEFVADEPGPGQVIVKLEAAGLCHSDVSVIDRTIPFPPPVVLGHEGAGVVEAIGPGVTQVAVGDHVVLSTLGNCGHCKHCESGHPTICRDTFGKLTRPFTLDGQKAFQFANTSAFAERTIVAQSQAIKIDERVPWAQASLLGCGVLTGFGAVVNRAKVQPGDAVAVIGVGGIGLNVIQGARIAAATTIIAVDANPAKETLARRFGATHFIDASGDADTVAAIKAATGGEGVDAAFECVGHVALLRNAIDALAPGGNAVIVGVPKLGAEATFTVATMYQDKGILACRYGTSRPHRDIPLLADLYLAGTLELDELVTTTYPIDDFDTALADMKAGKLARGVFTF